jgi:hypothetical protein
MAEQLISPQATGGAGTVFEHRLGAIMLSRLIRSATMPVGPQIPIFRVGFQQRNAGYLLDDFVAYALPRGGSIAPCIQFQAKKRIGITVGSREFRKVIAAAANTCIARADEVRDGRLLLGLAVAESEAGYEDFADLTHLTDMARADADCETFKLQLRKGVTRERQRTLHDNFSSAVAAQVAKDNMTVIDHLTHQILASLHIWHAHVDDDGSDWRAELDGLTDIAASANLTASDLMAHLCGLAAFFNKHGGLVSAAQVRRQLMSLLGVALTDSGSGPGSRRSNINVAIYGNGPVFAAESQVFHSPHFQSNRS